MELRITIAMADHFEELYMGYWILMSLIMFVCLFSAHKFVQVADDYGNPSYSSPPKTIGV